MTRLAARVAAHPRLAVFLAGCILPLAYAPFKFLPVFYLSYALAFWLAWQYRHAPKRLFILGWLFGFGQFFTGLSWLGEAFLVEAETFLWVLPFAVTLLPAGLALFSACAFGLWGVVFSGAKISRFSGTFLLVLFLAMAAYLRSTVLTGLPWNLPAMGWGSWLYLAQPVSLIGVHGLSTLALVSVAFLLAESVRLRWLALVLPLVIMVGSWGHLHIATPVAATDIQISIVQPNLAQRDKWLAEKRDAHIEKTFKLTQLALQYAPDTDLIIWPETAIPALIDEGTGFRDRLRAALTVTQNPPPYILTGAVRREGTPEAPIFYNSTMLWSGDGDLVARADKHHLVPFGEYLPFQSWLEAMGLQQLTRLRGGYASGAAQARLQAAGLPLIAPLICYEAIFPSLSGGHPRPEVLVNVTNDGWFGQWHGPYQHLAQVRLRAIEQGLPLLRAANTGISAAFDAKGRQIDALALGEAGVLSVKLPAARAPTLYHQYGDSFFWLFWVVSVGWMTARTKGTKI